MTIESDDLLNEIVRGGPAASDDMFAFREALECLTTESTAAEIDAALDLLVAAKPHPKDRDDARDALHARTETSKRSLNLMLKAAYNRLRRQERRREKDDKQVEFYDKEEMVAAINKVAALVRTRGDVKIAFFDGPPTDPVQFRSVRAAEHLLAQYSYSKVERGIQYDPEDGFDIWLRHQNRREYIGFGFFPDPLKLPDGFLNLWTGWQVEAGDGDCSEFNRFWRDVICAGDEELFRYMRRWVAWIRKHPMNKVGVSILLRSTVLGSGKSFLAEMIHLTFGERYSPVINGVEELTQKFNGNIETGVLVWVEEVAHPGNKSAVERIKTKISAPKMMIERKGVDAYMAPNLCNFIMTSNNDWVVYAVGGERRHLVCDVSPVRAQQRDYFIDLRKQMVEGGGLQALARELEELDVTGFDRENVPVTAGLRQQIALGLSPADKWLESMLIEGVVPFLMGDDLGNDGGVSDKEWKEDNFVVAKNVLLASFRQHVPGHPSNPTTMQTLATFLGKRLPTVDGSSKRAGPMQGERVRVFKLPKLSEARTGFEEAHKGYEFQVEKDEPANEEKQADTDLYVGTQNKPDSGEDRTEDNIRHFPTAIRR